MPGRYPLGIVEIAFRTLTDHTGASDKAAGLATKRPDPRLLVTFTTRLLPWSAR